MEIENNNSYCFMIRDSMDMDRFAKIFPLCCRDVSVCIVMYSVTDRTSFDSIDSYITELKNKCDDPKFIIIGNKIDLSPAVVTEEEGEQKARKFNTEFKEVSAARGTNISDSRSLIARITHESQQGGNNKKHIDDIKIIEAYAKPSSCC